MLPTSSPIAKLWRQVSLTEKWTSGRPGGRGGGRPRAHAHHLLELGANASSGYSTEEHCADDFALWTIKGPISKGKGKDFRGGKLKGKGKDPLSINCGGQRHSAP